VVVKIRWSGLGIETLIGIAVATICTTIGTITGIRTAGDDKE
jgi:hypothetical protein